jgi:hypothetical protein
MQNNTAVTAKSRGEEGANGKTFRIPISTGILSHYDAIRDSFWLFVWYVDKTTKEENGAGLILGGMPIPDSRPAADIGVPVKTIRRWRKRLADGDYIRAIRTPYGHCITLLKSKKWNWGPALVDAKAELGDRDLPKREISTPKESARSGHSDLPNRAERVPVSGIESARNGKYKEDKAVDFAVDLKNHSRHDSGRQPTSTASPFLREKPSARPTPLRACPSGRAKIQIGQWHREQDIAEALVRFGDTVADHLADIAVSTYYVTGDQAKRWCGEMVDSYRSAFAAIEYPFDLSSILLGWEFCDAVEIVVRASRNEYPRPRKWELCERALDECMESWDYSEDACNVGLPYWPPDFGDHIDRLFERERKR